MTSRNSLLLVAIACALSIPAAAAAQMRMRPPAPIVTFPAGADSIEMPFVIDGHLVTIAGVLNDHQLSFVFDTGAAGMALVDPKWVEILGLDVIGQGRVAGAGGGAGATVNLVGPVSLDFGGMTVERDMMAVGIGSALGRFDWDGVFGAGVLSKTVGVIDKLRLGPIELDNVVTTFSDKEGMRGVGRLVGDQPVIGNLGSAILRNYTVIVDHTHQRLGLLPNRTAARPFYFNTTGIAARPTPEDGRLPIHEVIPGSPAAEAGLVAGDVILEANGRTVEDHGGALRGLLMDPGLGEALDLVIERDGERLEITLVARRLVV